MTNMVAAVGERRYGIVSLLLLINNRSSLMKRPCYPSSMFRVLGLWKRSFAYEFGVPVTRCDIGNLSLDKRFDITLSILEGFH